MDHLRLAGDSFGFDIAYRDNLASALDMHSHAFHEMVYIFSGKGKHITEQGTYDMEPGELFIVRPGRPHAYSDRDHVKLVNIMFDLNRLPYPTGLLRAEPAFRAFFDFGPGLADDFRYRNRLTLFDDDRLRELKLRHHHTLREAFLEMISAGQASGEIRSDISSGEIFIFFLGLIAMPAMMRARSPEDVDLPRQTKSNWELFARAVTP